jgi:hypothetical protein
MLSLLQSVPSLATMSVDDGMDGVAQGERAKRECVICLDLESDHMVEECGHLCLCANCAPRFPPGISV